MLIVKAALMGFLLQVTHVAFAQTPKSVSVDPQKAMVIEQLLELTGALTLGEQIMSQMFEAQKKAHPEIDAAVWDRLASKMDMQDMRGPLIEIYDRHFSTPDLQATVDFYRSEAGQRVLKELPGVMAEAMALGQQWGQDKAAELQRELLREQTQKSKQ